MDTTTSTLKTKLEEVSSFFSTNPLSTPIGQIIDTATTPTPTLTPTTPPYPLLLQLIDILNSPPSTTDPSPTTFTHFTKAIKKKLLSKNHTVIELTVILIEVCVKNCAENNEKFRSAVLNREFLMELVRCGGGTTHTPTQDRILSLIQSLHFTFKSNDQVTSVYEELRDKGVEFPMVDFDEGMVPIVFKTRRVEQQSQSRTTVGDGDDEPILHPVRFNKQHQLTNPQRDKIRRELGVVQGNVGVMNEVLSEKGGGGGGGGGGEEEEQRFLEALFTTCKEMQARVMLLLGQIDENSEDLLISELLTVNDDLNNAFLRYTRHVKNKEKSLIVDPSSSLIDFSVESTVRSGAIPKRRNNNPALLAEDQQFEEFEDEILQSHTEQEFKEMEAWLVEFDGGFSSPQPPHPHPPHPEEAKESATLSSSDFDKFLEERARKK